MNPADVGEPVSEANARAMQTKGKMMTVAKKTRTDDAETIDVIRIRTETITLRLIGTTPLICNRMSEKARQQLLMPPPKMNAAEKASNLKHKPLEEYRASCHRLHGPQGATLLGMPSTAFKGAICDAALDLPGTRKAQIGRLVWVEREYVNVYGVPQIFTNIVRSADMNRTPDVRTRAIVPEWCASIDVTFVTPLLKAQGLANLIAAAGICIGVGDFRQQKGAGRFGAFEIVTSPAQEKQFARLMKEAGYKAQESALNQPAPYNEETAELLAWYGVEAKRRGFHVVGSEPVTPAKRARKAA